MTVGTVKWFNDERGFGYISWPEGGDDIFVHRSAIQTEGYRSLAAGQRVLFDIVDSPRSGRQAVNVHVHPVDVETARLSGTESLSAMTILEMTRLWSAQNDRWGSILTYAQSTRHPSAAVGLAFFKGPWRRAMSDYFQNVAGRYDAQAKAPMRVVRSVLDKMAYEIYPAARRAGLPDESFLFPDITTERGRPAIAVAGYSWMHW